MNFMKEAIVEAKKAYEKGEVPIGAVIVCNGEIIARGHNKREETNMAVSHAEVETIIMANDALGKWRLDDCEMYVTLEPCPMCAGAIINARLKKVYFGAFDEKGGALGSKINLAMCGFNHKPEVYGGIEEETCKEIMKEFFKGLRRA